MRTIAITRVNPETGKREERSLPIFEWVLNKAELSDAGWERVRPDGGVS